jgi:rhodanese-related sulfurtransferase
MQTLSVHELHAHIEENQKNFDILYLDVRTPSEFRKENIASFKNIPLDTLTSQLHSITPFKTVIVSCASGLRSTKAYKQLQNHVDTIFNVEGGIMAWKNANLPIIENTSSSISIMRQVQIIVGAGTLIGVILSHLYSSNFMWMSAFFGAGLLFTGVSNTCLLASMLEKMPWNK